MVEYLERDPPALANHLARHYGLTDGTEGLLRGGLSADRTHELGSAVLVTAASGS